MPPTFQLPWEPRCQTIRRHICCDVCRRNPKQVGYRKWVDWKGNPIPFEVLIAEWELLAEEEKKEKEKKEKEKREQKKMEQEKRLSCSRKASPIKPTPLIFFA